MAMNIVPKHPTLENFVEAFHKFAGTLCPEFIFVRASALRWVRLQRVLFVAFAFSFLKSPKGKNILFMLVI